MESANKELSYNDYDFNNYRNINPISAGGGVVALEPGQLENMPNGPRLGMGSRIKGWYKHSVDSICTTMSNSTVTLGNLGSEDGHFGLTRGQRFILFGGFVCIGGLIFLISLFRLPLAVINPTKFAAPFVMAMNLWMLSVGWLVGWKSYLRTTFSAKRRYISLAIFLIHLFVILAIYRIKLYPITIVACLLEVGAVACFCLSFVPGGIKTITQMSSATRAVIYSSLIG